MKNSLNSGYILLYISPLVIIQTEHRAGPKFPWGLLSPIWFPSSRKTVFHHYITTLRISGKSPIQRTQLRKHWICLLIGTTRAISLELMQRLGHKGTILVNDCHYTDRLERDNINLGEKTPSCLLK